VLGACWVLILLAIRLRSNCNPIAIRLRSNCDVAPDSRLQGHQYEEVGKQGSYTPVWTRQSGVPTNYPYTDGAGVLRQQSWWNASYGGGWPKRCQGGAKSANDPACKQIDWGPFFTFSAACTEFVRHVFSLARPRWPGGPL